MINNLSQAADDSASGTVKFYNPERGFGFIDKDSTNLKADVFFHIKNVKTDGDPKQGDSVDFLYQSTPRGIEAYSVWVTD